MISAGFISGDFLKDTNPPTPNGCAYYRLVLPARELQRIGWDVTVGLPLPNAEHGIGVAHDDGGFFGFDVSVFKLLMHESVPSLFELMQSKGQRVVVDVDDFHFALHEDNIANNATNPHANPQNNRMFYEMGIRQADTVTVATEFLADFYSRRCRDVRLVRNAVDCERFSPVVQPEVPVIGWLGGTLWRSGDIEMLRDWLPKFVEDHGLSVHHSGHIPNDSNHFAVRAGLKRVQTQPMATVPHVPELLSRFHIGLVPLTDCDFNRAKSYLKGLEYAASGIPFIATPTKEYRLLAEAGVGRLAETPDEWRDHATELLDPGVREAEARRQLSIVRERFDMGGMGADWAEALTDG